MGREELRAFVTDLGERPYRGDQIFRWLYTRGASRFDEMSDIAQAFRQRLNACARVGGVRHVRHQVSPADGTTKFLFALDDGRTIESVLIPPASAFEEDSDEEHHSTPPRERLTLCVSTQVGCPLDCAFCATGAMGYVRNLAAGEIVDQVLTIGRVTGRTITNVVFMGMGEPMLNYGPVMRAAEIMNEGMEIAARRITVSTAGWVDGIARMAEERRRFKLAVSLHSAVEDTRAALMPVTRRYPLSVLAEALRSYHRMTKLRVTYEVVLFDGINDTAHELRRLIAFARIVPCKINVIPYHSIAFTGPEGFAASLRPSPRLQDAVAQLRQANLTVMVRSSAGEDIAAACGQLAVHDARHNRPRGSTHERRGVLPHDHTSSTGAHANSHIRSPRRGERNPGKASR
ncbi:MAG: rlmN [Bacteroidetes bacterium]|jgi:23S rRNA (adenine2503-C2)-methyltransferase|nr:rlmN [Bacteroidota bacterium]